MLAALVSLLTAARWASPFVCEEADFVELAGGVARCDELFRDRADERGFFVGDAGSGTVHAAGLVEQPEHGSVLVVRQDAALAGAGNQ
ncbi:hypothetical protein AWC01_17050 [Mycobacterium doricum]|uniref:Uncharacterized protein n=1 Tax=Mycolicibacterium doricum TaxID=126673 RepID=A0A1X1SZ64_9MYCO|nr:hypothetical protein AWC01_17050 [Mycolicibacterium doricum]